MASKQTVRFRYFSGYLPSILLLAFSVVYRDLHAQSEPQIAFVSDIHLQDVFADLTGSGFQTVYTPSGKPATIRTMQAQATSTRLFNENYFALLTTLDQLAARGIRIVVLPGDFTDDGQPMNVKALRRILEGYAQNYGMRFFITTGNHDPVKPFGGPAGKSDFMGKHGESQVLAGKDWKGKDSRESTAATSEEINYWGYDEICDELREFGFFPHADDLFWSHPFLDFDYDAYSFEEVKAQSSLDSRSFRVGQTGYFLPDASYVVEPVEGIWLLAIDGNVYTPGDSTEHGNISWTGSGAGFNLALEFKKHQIEWIKKVTREAEKRGKLVLSFSHYPLVEFYNGTSEKMANLFGPSRFQLSRAPSPSTSEAYTDAGLRVHFAGHMHFNTTGIHTARNGSRLFNIQVPSLAAFPPAYKIMTKKSEMKIEVETVLLQEVPGMDEFFDLYRLEHTRLEETNNPGVWDLAILNSTNYLEYTRNHLKDLIRLRFASEDWPREFLQELTDLTFLEMAYWSSCSSIQEGNDFLSTKTMESAQLKEVLLSYPDLENIKDVSGISLLEDFYLVKNGNELGKHQIAEERLAFYDTVFTMALQKKTPASQEGFHTNLVMFLDIFHELLDSHPSDHFLIDLQKQTIRSLKEVY